MKCHDSRSRTAVPARIDRPVCLSKKNFGISCRSASSGGGISGRRGPSRTGKYRGFSRRCLPRPVRRSGRRPAPSRPEIGSRFARKKECCHRLSIPASPAGARGGISAPPCGSCCPRFEPRSLHSLALGRDDGAGRVTAGQCVMKCHVPSCASDSHRTQRGVAPDPDPGQASGVTREGLARVMKCHVPSWSIAIRSDDRSVRRRAAGPDRRRPPAENAGLFI